MRGKCARKSFNGLFYMPFFSLFYFPFIILGSLTLFTLLLLLAISSFMLNSCAFFSLLSLVVDEDFCASFFIREKLHTSSPQYNTHTKKIQLPPGFQTDFFCVCHSACSSPRKFSSEDFFCICMINACFTPYFQKKPPTGFFTPCNSLRVTCTTERWLNCIFIISSTSTTPHQIHNFVW